MERMAVFALAGGIPALGMAFVLWMAGVVGGRGLEVGAPDCLEAGPDRYAVTAPVHNTEETFKAASVNLQTRFVPKAGQRWPDRAARVRHQQTTQFAAVILEPQGQAVAGAEVAFPGASQFACTARAKLGTQKRFDARPTAEEAQAALEGRRTTGGARGLRGLRRRGL